MPTKEERICLRRWKKGKCWTDAGDCSKLTEKTRSNSQNQLLGSSKSGMLIKKFEKGYPPRYIYKPSQYFLNLLGKK